jgi:hypothetical protein
MKIQKLIADLRKYPGSWEIVTPDMLDVLSVEPVLGHHHGRVVFSDTNADGDTRKSSFVTGTTA